VTTLTWHRAHDERDLMKCVKEVGLTHGPIWLKVNWTSNAPGMFTDVPTLKTFLRVLPRPLIILEGHAVARVHSYITGDLRTESEKRRAIREGDGCFLRDTGLDLLLAEEGVQYMNVTEAVWKGETVPSDMVRQAVESAGEPLEFPELYDYVPAWMYAGRNEGTLVNLARLKLPDDSAGAWSLALKNMFGLIPDPNRQKYHTDLPGAILDINRLYSTLFKCVHLVEGWHSVVVHRKEGEREVSWGRYDLLAGERFVAWGQNPVQLDLEVAAVYGLDLSGRTLIERGRRFFPTL